MRPWTTVWMRPWIEERAAAWLCRFRFCWPLSAVWFCTWLSSDGCTGEPWRRRDRSPRRCSGVRDTSPQRSTLRSPRLRRSSPPTRALALALALSRLLRYRGCDASKPLLLALKGRVLDVSSGDEYYGPEGPYQLMAGKDASYAFAMMSLKAEDAHANLAGAQARSTRPAWHGLGTGVARAWHGRGTGVARAWHGLGVGLARAGHGLGGGRARLLLGSCACLGARGGARRPTATASGGAASQAASQARPRADRQGRGRAPGGQARAQPTPRRTVELVGGLIWHGTS